MQGVFEPVALPSVSASQPRRRSAKTAHEAIATRTARCGAGIFAGFPFATRGSAPHSRSRPSSSAQERLTLSRSTIDRKPSPLRPSGFDRSSSYCNHDKHTRPLDAPSRVRFEADRVASLPVDALRKVARQARATLASTVNARSADRSAIHFRGRAIRSVSCYTLRR